MLFVLITSDMFLVAWLELLVFSQHNASVWTETSSFYRFQIVMFRYFLKQRISHFVCLHYAMFCSRVLGFFVKRFVLISLLFGLENGLAPFYHCSRSVMGLLWSGIPLSVRFYSHSPPPPPPYAVRRVQLWSTYRPRGSQDVTVMRHCTCGQPFLTQKPHISSKSCTGFAVFW